MKHCTKCKIEKESTDFNKRTRSWDGLSSRCKVCLAKDQKDYSNRKGPNRRIKSELKRFYNMSVEEYNALLSTQGNVCAICGCNEPGGRGRWHVDHNHLTGINRGLLCHHCNVGLGHFFDDAGLLRKAAIYLER